jgi:hypothetical protein
LEGFTSSSFACDAIGIGHSMLQALLRGKLSRDHEQIEDILTSNVFGLLRYDHPEIICDFLGRAILHDGCKALDAAALHAGGISISWEFWPWWSEAGCIACEPDVAITLENQDRHRIYLLIEAKLHAGKSSLSDQNPLPFDQLAREWDNLVSRAQAKNSKPVLIYMTSHFCIPRSEIADSINEVRFKRGSEATIAWLSWRELPNVLDKYAMTSLRSDLRLLLERMGLTYFDGIMPVRPPEIDWRFQAGAYDWSVAHSGSLGWGFK